MIFTWALLALSLKAIFVLVALFIAVAVATWIWGEV